jgi:hypothetical protein
MKEEAVKRCMQNNKGGLLAEVGTNSDTTG